MATISQVRQNPEAFNKEKLIRIRQKLFERDLKIEKDISATNEQLRSPDRKISALFKALAFNSENATIILSKNADQALKIVKEYGEYPLLRAGLMQAVRIDGIISAKFRGGEITIDIDMDKAAGSIDNYGNAVKLARKVVSKSKKPGNPFRASLFWFRNIYSVDRLGKKVTKKKKNKETGEMELIDVTEKYAGKYDETMQARFNRFAGGKPAPWWKILEVGNASIKMSSDRGGVGMPYAPPTHFVATSKQQIKSIVSNSYKTELDLEMGRFERKLTKLKKLKKQNEEDMALVNELLAGAGKTRQEAALEKIRARLQERYAETQADYRRIEILIRRLAAGERIEEKVTVGRKTRIRVIQILNELNLEFKDLEK